MNYTTKQLRAIKHHCVQHNLRPSLATYPIMYFHSKETGEESKVSMQELLDHYTAYTMAEARERSRQRKLERKK